MQNKSSWLERVEEIVNALEGSTVSEFELTEEGTKITIRRSTGMVLTAAPTIQVAPSNGLAQAPAAPAAPRGKKAKGGKGGKAESGIAVTAPLTGVYYAAASPTTPAFANVGDVVQVGQVVALIEAMKVFNEINSEVSGRVVSIVAKSGEVIQKGDVILRLEPLS